jgi:hypothetical protein
MVSARFSPFGGLADVSGRFTPGRTDVRIRRDVLSTFLNPSRGCGRASRQMDQTAGAPGGRTRFERIEVPSATPARWERGRASSMRVAGAASRTPPFHVESTRTGYLSRPVSSRNKGGGGATHAGRSGVTPPQRMDAGPRESHRTDRGDPRTYARDVRPHGRGSFQDGIRYRNQPTAVRRPSAVVFFTGFGLSNPALHFQYAWPGFMLQAGYESGEGTHPPHVSHAHGSLRPPSMRSDIDHSRRSLGSCPDCGSAIPARRVLIEYETADGRPAMYAECPDCRDIVHPA